jgi:transcriptional regulator with GAF, ATPase, and Fis domain
MADERTSKFSERVLAHDAYVLLVSCEEKMFTAPVPRGANISIGRAASCDVRVVDDSVSRTHVLIRSGETLTVEDLGSTNGTHVQGRPLVPGEQAAIHVGSVIEVGKALVVVQRAGTDVASAVEQATPTSVPDGLLLEDPMMKQIYRMVDVVAPTTISVLILGETGVGKEVFAETMHKRSARAHKPFLKLNCAALPESILESELFGHERGAFTGALQTKIGLFESADGGTVFLDELGEMPLSIQAKLLRVLESGEVMRVGSVKTKRIDIRLIAATNRDLNARIDQGLFRSDLFFRINGFALTIPPLRERRDDLIAFARTFLDSARRRFGAPSATFSPAAVEALTNYSWPGNIRELRNTVDRAALLCKDRVVEVSDLAINSRGSSPPTNGHLVAAPVTPAPEPERAPQESSSTQLRAPGRKLRTEMDAIERERILAALEQCGGNQSRAARVLGMARRTLLVRLDEYGVTRPRKGNPAP